jgi:hypothetical protein
MSLPEKMPDWVKKGPVTLRNYDLRAIWFGGEIKQWGDEWPFLTRQEDLTSTADEGEWDAYFRDHLGGFPPSYRLFRDGIIKHWNAPDIAPGPEFDPSWKRQREVA